MSITISRDFTFQAAIYFKESFLMNLYDLTLYMDVNTESIREQNIAMERIKYFLSNCLENSVFVQDTEKKVIEQYYNAGLKLSTLPEEPYDQIIALLLLVKLNAITEGKLTITDIILGSRLSDDVKFSCDLSSPLGPFQESGWWTGASATSYDISKIIKKEKIVKLVKPQIIEWDQFDLEWDEAPTKKQSEIIFTPDM